MRKLSFVKDRNVIKDLVKTFVCVYRVLSESNGDGSDFISNSSVCLNTYILGVK